MSEQIIADNSAGSRKCHIIKRDDFDGYGFNLHAEKGKQGQYIGKVDEGSPAELAGLREGDRIISVNDIQIGNETHKQVVNRIKALSNEVCLDVVSNNLVISKKSEVVDNTINVQQSESEKRPSNVPSERQDSSVMVSNNNNNNSGANNKIINLENVTIKDESKFLKLERNKESPENNNSTVVKSSSDGLQLPLTAAEMRAQLMAKKKQNPKIEVLDLRQKYEIAQKL